MISIAMARTNNTVTTTMNPKKAAFSPKLSSR